MCLVVLCLCVVVCQLMYGGITDGGAQNDVWATTNGRVWIWVAGYSDGIPHPYNNERYAETFPPWFEAATCQDNNYKQYRAGGRRDGMVYNDVWTSLDGMTWVPRTESAAWEPRYFASMVSDTLNNGTTSSNNSSRQQSEQR